MTPALDIGAPGHTLIPVLPASGRNLIYPSVQSPLTGCLPHGRTEGLDLFGEQVTQVICELRDPRDGAIRYVGRTDCYLWQRLTQHCAFSVVNNDRQDWIEELRHEGLRPIIGEIDRVEDQEAAGIERWWITERIRDGHEILNQERVGRGAPNSRCAGDYRLPVEMLPIGMALDALRMLGHPLAVSTLERVANDSGAVLA